jgi:acyl-CoA dehydrogenase
VSADMVQVFGGYGISKEHPVEKLYRDAKLLQIMDGTNEMVSLKAADELLAG